MWPRYWHIPVIHTDTAATDNLGPLDNLPVTTSNEEQSAITHFLPRGSVARGQKSGGRWWVLKEVTNVADYPVTTGDQTQGWTPHQNIAPLIQLHSNTIPGESGQSGGHNGVMLHPQPLAPSYKHTDVYKVCASPSSLLLS